MSNVKGRMSLQTSAEFLRTYNAQVHETVDAIAAVVEAVHHVHERGVIH